MSFWIRWVRRIFNDRSMWSRDAWVVVRFIFSFHIKGRDCICDEFSYRSERSFVSVPFWNVEVSAACMNSVIFDLPSKIVVHCSGLQCGIYESWTPFFEFWIFRIWRFKDADLFCPSGLPTQRYRTNSTRHDLAWSWNSQVPNAERQNIRYIINIVEIVVSYVLSKLTQSNLPYPVMLTAATVCTYDF